VGLLESEEAAQRGDEADEGQLVPEWALVVGARHNGRSRPRRLSPVLDTRKMPAAEIYPRRILNTLGEKNDLLAEFQKVAAAFPVFRLASNKTVPPTQPCGPRG
jgi:hypothetical protein